MSVLFGMYQPEKGEIRKNGQVVHIKDPNDANALGIGMVHQHFKLVDVFSVLDNIILGVEPTVTPFGFLQKAQARKKVMELSERYGLKVDPDAMVEDITVGMQQRTEILKMLYRDNEVLIFDEPTAVLTPQEIEELMKIMKELTKEGKSILFITHKLDEIKAVADRCTVLRKGKYVGTVDVATTSKEELSEMMVGRKVQLVMEKTPLTGRKRADRAESDRQSKKRGAPVVNNVSTCTAAKLSASRASTQRSERPVWRAHRPDGAESGKIFLNNKDITHMSIRKRNEAGLSHIPEDRHKHGLVLDYSLENNLCSSASLHPNLS